ncbi:hypothetical protein D3C86_2098450 [compost metagenome]
MRLRKGMLYMLGSFGSVQAGCNAALDVCAAAASLAVRRAARSQAFSWKKNATACTVGSSKLSVSEAHRLPVTA